MSLRRLGGSSVVRQRAAADAMELTVKIARYNPKFDRREFDQNVLIRPVVVCAVACDSSTVAAIRILGTALLRPFVALGRSIRCHSTNLAVRHRQSQPAALTQGYVAAFAETCYGTAPMAVT
jgi:hypothetical protein